MAETTFDWDAYKKNMLDTIKQANEMVIEARQEVGTQHNEQELERLLHTRLLAFDALVNERLQAERTRRIVEAISDADSDKNGKE